MTGPAHQHDALSITRKRLHWRSHHRGIKEMDLLVGGFADLRINAMDSAELSQFATILDIPDQVLLAWVTEQETVPQAQSSPLLFELLAFRPKTFT